MLQSSVWEHCALHCTALHCAVLHCAVLHCTALRCAVLHFRIDNGSPWHLFRFARVIRCAGLAKKSWVCKRCKKIWKQNPGKNNKGKNCTAINCLSASQAVLVSAPGVPVTLAGKQVGHMCSRAMSAVSPAGRGDPPFNLAGDANADGTGGAALQDCYVSV